MVSSLLPTGRPRRPRIFSYESAGVKSASALLPEHIRQKQIVLRDLVPRKAGHQLARGDRFRPVKQPRGAGQRAGHLLGREPLPQQAEVEILVPLGQAAAVVVAQQRDMHERGRRKAKQAVQPDLPGRG